MMMMMLLLVLTTISVQKQSFDALQSLMLRLALDASQASKQPLPNSLVLCDLVSVSTLDCAPETLAHQGADSALQLEAEAQRKY